MKTQTIGVSVMLGLFFGLFLGWTAFVIHTLYFLDTEPRVSSIPRPLGPDISHCFEGDVLIDLWDCVRHVQSQR